MRNLIFILIILTGCINIGNKDLIKIAPEFKSEFAIDTAIRFQNVRQVAYGYNFAIPTGFIEEVDTIGQVDSSVFISTDRKSKIIYFVDGTNDNLSKTDTANFLFDYLTKVENGKHHKTNNSMILKSVLRYNNDFPNYRGDFILLGQKDTIEYIWMTDLSEWPISGDLVFKNMIITYPISDRIKYQPIGVELTNYFGYSMKRK